MSNILRAVLEATPRGTLKGVRVAAFDTRYRMSAWLFGSAARGISNCRFQIFDCRFGFVEARQYVEKTVP